MSQITARIQQLQHDLRMAMQISNKQIAERLKLNESKSDILQKLAEATKLTTFLEAQLKRYEVATLHSGIISPSQYSQESTLVQAESTLVQSQSTLVQSQSTLVQSQFTLVQSQSTLVQSVHPGIGRVHPGIVSPSWYISSCKYHAQHFNQLCKQTVQYVCHICFYSHS